MKNKYRIFVADKEKLEKKTEEILSKYFEIFHFKGEKSSLVKILKPNDILWVRFDHYLDKNFFKNCPKINCIATNATGLNHIDEKEAKNKDIDIINLKPNDNYLDEITSTSELSVGLLYNLVRRINLAAYDVKNGNWNRSLFKGSQINNFSIGIIGFGRVGQHIYKQIEPSVKDVFYFDKRKLLLGKEFKGIKKSSSLNSLLSKSDAIFISAKEDSSKKSIIDDRNIKKLKKSSYLVNCSRGSLINFDVCYKALLKGRIAGLAVDVFDGEERGKGIKKSVLKKMSKENLIITPHIGGNTKEAWEISEKIVAEKLINHVLK
tara:strand:- start:173 stop:1132 length:960 start_codon:yes stop_codon:yes gene_type:complete